MLVFWGVYFSDIEAIGIGAKKYANLETTPFSKDTNMMVFHNLAFKIQWSNPWLSTFILIHRYKEYKIGDILSLPWTWKYLPWN